MVYMGHKIDCSVGLHYYRVALLLIISSLRILDKDENRLILIQILHNQGIVQKWIKGQLPGFTPDKANLQGPGQIITIAYITGLLQKRMYTSLGSSCPTCVHQRP